MNQFYSHESLKWIKLGIAALGISGIYSIILVFLRTPVVTDFFVDKAFFKTALVVHVDLSVLVWLLIGSVIIWLKNVYFQIPDLIYKSGILSIALMALSPLMNGDPIMNNYIPMLNNIMFISGLSIFFTVIFIISIISISKIPSNFSQYSAFGGACIFLVSIVCFILSYDKINIEIGYPLDLHGFYEMLFWSGGHALQFLYIHIMYVIWITLLDQRTFPRMHLLAMWINVLALLPILPIHLIYDIDSPEFISFCTDHMRYAGGLSSGFIMAVTIAEIFYAKFESKWLFGINFSLFLFGAGGAIGVLISETNVTIPAHYHGSIVGVSIAVMTMFYSMINLSEKMLKYAKSQISIYAIGQIMHIGGLAWSGGYGVLRKNPDMIIPVKAKISMAIMGLGGILAIIGGLMFVVICISALRCTTDK